MEDNHGRLRIIKRPHKNIFTPKLAITGLSPLIVLMVAVVVWELINKDAGLFSLDAHEIHSHIGDILVNTSWYRIVFYTYAYLLLFAVMLGPKNGKIVIQRIIEIVRNIRQNKPWGQSLFVLGVTVFSILFISLNILGASLTSMSIVQYPLHMRSFEDHTFYYPDRRINKHPQRLPFDMAINATVTRYNTEDVLLRCELHLLSKASATVSVIIQSLYWTTDNGRRITETDKIHIHNSFTETNRKLRIGLDQYHEFLIESVLSIELIDDGDYGTYLCKYFVNLKEVFQVQVSEEEELLSLSRPMDLDHKSFHKYMYEPPKIQMINMEEVGLTEVTNSVFHLKKQEIPVKTARVSPGGLFIDHAPYWSLADPGDIIINTTISGKDNADCCWLPIRLYKYILYFFGYQNLVWRGKKINQHQRYLIRQQCICIEDLVLYNSTVAFVRTRYNSTTQRQERFQVGHPRQMVLVPELPHVFKLHQTPGESLWSWSDLNQTCAETNDSSEICRMILQYIDHLFHRMMLVDVYNWIFSFATTIIILGMCWFVTQGWIHCFILPILDPPAQTEDYTYDLYLMYDEEDKYETQVAKTLREHIVGPTFSVFDPWRDIAPGHSVPLEQQKAIEESRTFCVIISNSSENDDEQKFELAAIKTALAARAAPNTDNSDSLFTIQIGECKVDCFLSPVNAKVPVNDREANELDRDVLFTFIKWTLTSKDSWITMQRGGVEAVHQRLHPYAQSSNKYDVFLVCNYFLSFYFLFILDLDYPYKKMTQVRHDCFEAE